MGLDTYIFKTTTEQVMFKITELLDTRKEAEKQAFKSPNGYLFFIDDDMNYMDKLNPDIYWRKFNQITAWFSKNILDNTSGKMESRLGILTIDDLSNFRKDCYKILHHCTLPNGKLQINKSFCKKIFPQLNLPLSGNTNYDECFIEDIKTAIKDIDLLLLTSSHPNTLFIFYADY